MGSVDTSGWLCMHTEICMLRRTGQTVRKSGALMNNGTSQGKDNAIQSLAIRSPLSQISAPLSFHVPWEVYWLLFLLP